MPPSQGAVHFVVYQLTRRLKTDPSDEFSTSEDIRR